MSTSARISDQSHVFPVGGAIRNTIIPCLSMAPRFNRFARRERPRAPGTSQCDQCRLRCNNNGLGNDLMLAINP
jgi:hypothetical protein